MTNKELRQLIESVVADVIGKVIREEIEKACNLVVNDSINSKKSKPKPKKSVYSELIDNLDVDEGSIPVKRTLKKSNGVQQLLAEKFGVSVEPSDEIKMMAEYDSLNFNTGNIGEIVARTHNNAVEIDEEYSEVASVAQLVSPKRDYRAILKAAAEKTGRPI